MEMSEDGFLDQFVNKRVDFSFHGTKLQFYLSQSLFSSHDIDDGTRLLLKTIAQEIELDRVQTVLDVGCGVGVLGTCLKKYRPSIEVTFQDRDGLALAFTQLNAKLNHIQSININSSLALQDLDQNKFDLIVSNLPAKAGQSVLQDIVARIPNYLTERGRAAIVIIKPLETLIEETLQEAGYEILLGKANAGYAVFHYRATAGLNGSGSSLAPYVRGRYDFKVDKTSFTVRTAYNIPEFDTLGYHTLLAMKLIKTVPVAGRALFWNPGQGHLPVFVQNIHGRSISEYILGGRDLLSIRLTEANLLDQGVSQRHISVLHRPHLLAVTGEFDFIGLFPAVDPGVPWHQVLLEKCYRLLKPGGRLLLSAKSAFMFRLLTAQAGFSMKVSKKRHGFRCVLLEK